MTMELLHSADFWIGLLKIIWIDIILSGDNAVVIALATRSLRPQHRSRAIVLGTLAAVVLRVSLTVVVAWLMALPYLQILGGALLLWVGIQLLGNAEEPASTANEVESMWTAIRFILVADFVMSLDNVIAVAAAAKGHAGLVLFGLALSIPLVIFSSTLMVRLMDRFPLVVTLGAALIGWVAGETILGDPMLAGPQHLTWQGLVAGVLGALLVVSVGKWKQRQSDNGTAPSP